MQFLEKFYPNTSSIDIQVVTSFAFIRISF